MSINSPKQVGWKGDSPTEIVTDNFNKGVIKSGQRILDVGCGFGRNSNWLAQKGLQVTAININDGEILEARKKAEKLGVQVNYLHADAVSLPFPGNSFDVVLDLGCSHMLPDKESQQESESEAARVLAERGYLIFFGFSKEHPSYKNKPDSPMFRDLEDIQKMYGQNFEIVSITKHSWKPKPEEHSSITEHMGLNVVMRKK